MVTLTTLTNRLERIPISIKVMKELMPEGVDVFAYPQLKGKTRHELFKNKRGIVVLIPKKGSKQGHYIRMLPRPRGIEYFSSLGNSFEQELALLGQKETHIHRIVGKNYIYNRTKLQSGDYSIKTCAQFVYARLALYKLKLREFVQLFHRHVNLESPDEIVALMCVLPFAL